MIELPNKNKCYNLPEQVAQNLLNITYLAEQYKNIDALPAIWAQYKSEFDADIETFGNWTTTFEGWEETLATYLTNMSTAAVGAIAGQNIAPANVAATGNITAPSIIETMTGYSVEIDKSTYNWNPIYVGVCKNGNKVSLVVFGSYEKQAADDPSGRLLKLNIPGTVGTQLYPYTVAGVDDILESKPIAAFSTRKLYTMITGETMKVNNFRIDVNLHGINALTDNTTYFFRYEVTFLLSENLVS